MVIKLRSDVQTIRKLPGSVADLSQHWKESESVRLSKKRSFTDHVNQCPIEIDEDSDDAGDLPGSRKGLFLPSSPDTAEKRRVKQKTHTTSDSDEPEKGDSGKQPTVENGPQPSQALPKDNTDRNVPSIPPVSRQTSKGDDSDSSRAITPASPLRRRKTLPDLRVSSAPSILQGATSLRKSQRVKEMKVFGPTGELKFSTSTHEPKPAPAGRSKRKRRADLVEFDDEKPRKVSMKRNGEAASSQAQQRQLVEQPTPSQDPKKTLDSSEKPQREPGTTSDGEIDYSYFVHKFLNPRRR